MGFFLIIPILAAEIWLVLTTGRRALRKNLAEKGYGKLPLMIVVGIILAIFFTFFAQYNMGKTIRLISFPVPTGSFRLENDKWTQFTVPQPYLILSQIADVCTGLIAPLVPVKIKEFLDTVKKELN